MTYSQPRGYRLPATVSLPSLSRALDRFGWPLWRREVVRAAAIISVELLASPGDHDSVYRRWSHDQITEADLVLSLANQGGILYRAAEFLDVGHGLMHRMSALPLPSKIDLRCRAQLMDDRDDAERRWTYILFGTEHQRLEDAFLQLRGIEEYPLSIAHETPGAAPDSEDAERAAVWDRVLAPYLRSSPLSLSAPEPQVTFDIAESLYHDGRDAEFEAEGKTTVSAVVDEVSRILGPDAPTNLRDELTKTIEG